MAVESSRIFTADTTASENRRSVLPPTNGMLLPVSVLANVHNNNNSTAYQSSNNIFEDRKQSFQRDRSNTVNNSRLSEMFDESTGPSASSSPEEYNSCLANVLSVVLLQKNRHLLLAGCTDIIQAMAKNGSSSELCEIIARTPTCPLPLIDLDRNAASKKRQAKTTPVNPLGSRVIEWAGLKIPLKFLHKFHTLFSIKDRKATLDGSEEEKALSYQASTSQIREEYCYAHDSSLLAIALLIKGSQAVVEHVLTLPGAPDLLQLSVSHYANRHNGEIDEVILNAVNAIQMEKQRLVRMRARESMLTVQTSSSSASGGLPRPHPSAKSPVLPHMRRSQSQEATKNTSQSNKPIRPVTTIPFSGDKATEDLAWAMATIQPSPPRLVSQSQALSLTNGLETNFRAEYMEETEKGRLYLMKQADQVSKERGPPSDFTVQAAGQLRSTLQASIHHPPSIDNLLETSLRKIDANTEESILLQKKSSGQQDVPGYAEKLGLFPPQSLSTPGVPEVSFTSYYNNGSQSLQSRMPESNSASADAAGFLQHGLSASRDFFGHLPAKPFIPKRIEAKDCIHPTEDLDKIREKFRLIADNAVMKIKGEGDEIQS